MGDLGVISAVSEPTNKVVVRPESQGDHAAIREVNRLAFEGEGEARLVDALRDGGLFRASLVAEEGAG